MTLSFRGSGKVFYKDKELECDLYLNENEGGILFNIRVNEAIASYLTLPLDIEQLSGELSNGYKFTLINASRTKTNSNISTQQSTFTYQAEYLLEGIGEDKADNLLFDKMYFSIPGIMEWGGISGYKINKTDYSLISNEDTEEELYHDDNLSIRYMIHNSMLPISEFDLLTGRIILNQRSIIVIELFNGAHIESFISHFNQLKRLIELSVLHELVPNKITGISKNIVMNIGDAEYPREINIISYKCRKEESEEATHRAKFNWIMMRELVNNQSFQHFFDRYNLLEPIVELYIELLHQTVTSHRRIFMNLVEALETYHSRMVTNDKKSFISRVDALVHNLPEEWRDKDREFLLKNQKRHQNILLRNRIADLLYAEDQYYFDTGDIEHNDFPQVIADTRNFYIHYDERIKSRGRVLTEEELQIYNRCLFQILEFYILKELGFTDFNYIRNKLNMRWGNVSQDLLIQKQSDEMKSKKARD